MSERAQCIGLERRDGVWYPEAFRSDGGRAARERAARRGGDESKMVTLGAIIGRHRCSRGKNARLTRESYSF